MQYPIVHYPSNVKKYNGRIERTPKKDGGYSFRARISTNEHRISKSFPSEEKAMTFLKEKNLEFGFRIKNMVREWEDYMEVELHKDVWSKFDKEDLPIVEKHVCNVSVQGYVVTCSDGKLVKLHNLILYHKPSMDSTVDHISCDKLDNRRSNIRIATRRTQSINKKLRKCNKSGIIGVHVNRKQWMTSWRDVGGHPRFKSFSILEYGNEGAKALAVAYRKHIEETLPHYKEALVG
ncbi:HNH-family endonuclease [Brazilian marseillevirus]|uniref:HNH-family endonuclease n=1 Tax=Brazilian marseillevirus TaxID=1813599 RepID=UPI000785FFB5|nr:HNH-family endonuclease [Brazilian marseillevirus]AMQ10887.1 HNH-family endonuclease [Brazilian marseillevirus]